MTANKTMLCAALIASSTAAVASQSPHSLTGNVGLYSQYIFRGLTQTDRKPALQGGFDYSHADGFYAGIWGSNVSWISDTAQTAAINGVSSSIELDLYAGYKWTRDDWTVDLGFLRYEYPGKYPSGFVKPNTNELYVAGVWKWVSLKYSHSLGDTFGVDNAKNTYYLDLTAAIPLPSEFTLTLHVGRQKFKGANFGVSNDVFSYTDYKAEVAKSLTGNWSLGAGFTDSNAKDIAYTILGRNLGKSTGYAFVKKTF